MEQFAYNTTSTDGFFKLNHSSQLLSHYDQCMILQKLMSDIDADHVLEQLLSQTQKRLNTSGISLSFENQLFAKGNCSSSLHCKTLSLIDNHMPLGQIKYYHRNNFSLQDHQLLHELHNCVKQVLKNVIRHEQVKKLALKDPLTGLGNRAAYDEHLERYISLSQRQNTRFGLLIIDLDHFKPVNDKYGHQEGDRALHCFAHALNSALRGTDLAFRIGGDEFCCLFEEASDSTNQMIAQRIQRAIANENFLIKHHISCSIGSATYQKGDSPAQLFDRADGALYQAKSAGRDCIRIA